MDTQWISRIAMFVVSTAAFGLVAEDARAQGYPNRSITFIVPAGPGTGNDVIARIMAQKMSESMGQPVVISNVTGASAAIGIETTAKAPPDGYSFVLASTSQILNQYVSKVRYDILKDFAPVSLAGSLPFVLAVSNSLSVKSVNELVALAKSKPGKINYAAPVGQLQHLMGEMFKSARGIDIVMISYKSSMDAQTDVMAGRVEIWFTTLASALPQAKAEKVRILAVTGEKRASVLPEVPTMVEAGLPTLDVSAEFFILAPAGTPKPIIATLNGEVVKAIATKEVRARLAAAGVEPKSSTAEELDAHLKSEVAKWSKIIRDSGIRAD